MRDFNYYPHFQDAQVPERVQETLRSFFEDEIMGDYAGGSDCMSSPLTSLTSPLLDFEHLHVLSCVSVLYEPEGPSLTDRYIRYNPR